MEVFALFDDQSCEKVTMEFLKPSNKGNRVDITYLSSVTDNIRESSDKGIKETYVLASRYLSDIPESISVLVRGFEKSVQGRSADLAFSLAFVAYLVNQGYIVTKCRQSTFFATGVIGLNGEIIGIKGLKNKIMAALKKTEDSEGILFYPYENYSELVQFMKDDMEFDAEVKRSKLELVPIKTLSDIFDFFSGEVKQKKIRYKNIVWVGLSICITVVLICFITKSQFASKEKTDALVLPTITNALNNDDKNNTKFDTDKILETEKSVVATPIISVSSPKSDITTPLISIPSPKSKELKNPSQAFRVLETIPEDGAVNIPLNTIIHINYSREITNDKVYLSLSIDVVDPDNNYATSENVIEGNKITLTLHNLKPSTEYTVKIPECTDKDGNTCAPYSFRFTTTDKEINRYFNDGRIRFKYPYQFELKERAVEGESNNKEYISIYNGISLKLVYFNCPWPSITEQEKALKDSDRLNCPGRYAYAYYPPNVLVQTLVEDNDISGALYTMYTNGMGNTVAKITITSELPVDKLNSDHLQLMTEIVPMIGQSLEILDGTPCNPAVYGDN